MKWAKSILKVSIITIISFVSFIVLYLVIAFVLSRIPVNSQKTEQGQIAIFIITNGVHTDIAVPVSNQITNWSIKTLYSHTKEADSMCQFVSFGWGNRAFYLETPTWGDLKFKTAFNAVFGMGKTAMHVTYYRNITESKTAVKILISEKQYKQLVTFIENSFVQTKQCKYLKINTTANYNNYDAFYEAEGTYCMLKTCNTWTNSALKHCGQKACARTPFDKGIFYQYRK